MAKVAMDSDFDPPFDLTEPENIRAPILFNSPHSGRIYPKSFLKAARLDAMALRRSEDAFVDRLLAGVAESGTPLMSARFPRAFLDVNREPYELDPRMFEGRLPAYANTGSLRVAGGLGTIARIVGESHEIYAARLPVSEGLRRIEDLYKPYHRALRCMLNQMHRQFGVVVLVDCHSMPSSCLSRDVNSRRPERTPTGGRNYCIQLTIHHALTIPPTSIPNLRHTSTDCVAGQSGRPGTGRLQCNSARARPESRSPRGVMRCGCSGRDLFRALEFQRSGVPRSFSCFLRHWR